MSVPHVYAFEGIDESLGLVPLAARRALDVARVKLSLEAWTSSPRETRFTITALGGAPVVDAAAVRTAVADASTRPLSSDAPADPSPDAVPSELARLVTEAAWRALAPVDRYALWKVSRVKHPEDILPRACAEILSRQS